MIMNQTVTTAYLLLPEIIVFSMILVILLIGAFQIKPALATSSGEVSPKPNSNVGYWLTFFTLIALLVSLIEPYFNISDLPPFISFHMPEFNYFLMNAVLRNIVTDMFKIFLVLTSFIALATSRPYLNSSHFFSNEYWVIFLICLLESSFILSNQPLNTSSVTA